MLSLKLFKNFKSPIISCYYSNRNIIKLKERGLFQDVFPDTSVNNIIDLMNANRQTVYTGFDPTADSLHIGNLLILINLLHWQRAGHQPIAIIGGATAKIGDPSGKNTDREKLSNDFVDNNVNCIRKNIKTIFENHRKYFWKDNDVLKDLILLNNEDWFNKMSAVKLIGDAGRYLRMGTLLSRSSVQNRLQSVTGMSFTEFSYQLFQAYDWLYLHKTYGCNFQIGGSDQMGNIMSGHELISKVYKNPVYGLTVPLITTEMGDKYGKSAGNAMWLSSQKTSPFTLYQFFIRTTDNDVENMLKLFTFLPIGTINDIMQKHKEKPELRKAQKLLAENLLLLVHGENGLKAAKTASKALYEGSVEALSNMEPESIKKLFQGATIVEILPEAGQNIIDLAMKVKCFSTKADALRIIGAGGFYINYQKVNNPSEIINFNVHKLPNNITLLRVGKRNHYIVKWLSI